MENREDSHIVIENLHKDYIERRTKKRISDNSVLVRGSLNKVLDNINLAFSQGEMACILGPSGCGKSTMLRIMAGFDKPTQGKITIKGQVVAGPSPNNIFVFQHSSLLPWMTVRQNVGLGLRGMRDKKAMRETIQEYIEIVELEGCEDAYPHELSGGMQRRAELARALAVNPDILFMDEPFSGLDFLTHMRMREEVVNVHQYIQKTIVFVTHDIDDALIMGDHIVILGKPPTKVKLDRKLDFPRPRDFEKFPELNQLRSEIFMMLGVPYAV